MVRNQPHHDDEAFERNPLVELFNVAQEHVASVAVLPGDPEADEVVERLIRARSASKRAIARK